ncbi:SLC13 family permease [Roseicitreum antarcticum]|uniref:TrkA-C domain-containing protein n=1 Tax=Roseicitreum antarcticum TaxID=564137 RepID=A0A1H3D5P3_9RHOB|nr:SLC13 family permease [Roseicitreum antarcticum]SDX61630.1 TrkA-C domain-containing protein [Roseicitreum antarcticum]
MTTPQVLIFAILVATMGLFLWGRLRHDVVALAALMACVLAGLVPAADAFAGFGHPAVITVACVLVLSKGLQNTGAVDWLARSILPRDAGRLISTAALMGLGAALSGFMNNVGAMALLMPVAVQLAKRLDLTPGQVLMPLAFGTILGGMTTLVGTPPNLIVSGFREQAGLGPFAMFDFAPVGVAVALLGVLFIAVVGWRLVPARTSATGEGFETGAYMTELRVPGESKAVGLTLRAFEREIEDSEAQIVGLVRNQVRMTAPHGGRRIRAGDILLMEADVGALAEAVSVFGIQLEEQVSAAEEAEAAPRDGKAGKARAKADATGVAGRVTREGATAEQATADDAAAEDVTPKDVAAGTLAGENAVMEDGARAGMGDTFQNARSKARAANEEEPGKVPSTTSDADSKPESKPESKPDPKPDREDDIVLREMAVLPGSTIVGRSASDLQLRTRYGLNLLAIARVGHPPRARLRTVRLKSGDLLLMQGATEAIGAFINDTGCVPLGARELRIPDKRMAIIAGVIMLGAIAIVTLGLLPAAAAFALGLLASMLFRTVPPRQVYTAIDWPVIVLLAALIPVAGAMQTTGAADLLARFLVDMIAQGNPVAALAVVLITTMFLSDVMNNAATAAVMCPIALGIAAALGVNPDSFLMAVAIGASCAFLTPIGHQNNTLILGPGGFRFGDYWRLGLPLEALVVAVSMPLLLLVWPL